MEKLTAPTTIREVLEELDKIIEDAIKDNSFLGIFAFVYRRVTAQIQREIALQNFEDNERMEAFDVAFANQYIDAIEAYKNNQPLSKSWKIAFDCQKDRLTIIQHLMMGMNAHINLDLSIAASTATKDKPILGLKNDFEKINDILSALTNEVQSKLGNVSKLMFLLDWMGKNTDEKILDFSMKKARAFAWKNAVQLAALIEEERPSRINHIDNVVLELSKCIKTPQSRIVQFLLRLIHYFEEREVAKIMEGLQIEYDALPNNAAVSSQSSESKQ